MDSRPRSAADIEARYQSGDLPWDTGRVDAHLQRILGDLRLSAGSRVLEIGSGTGTNAIWLAALGHKVVAIDQAQTAVKQSRQRAAEAKVAVRFVVADFLRDPIPRAPFDFAFDRGCFHTFRSEPERHRFVERLWGLIVPGGWWCSLAGNPEGAQPDSGPPRLSAGQIVSAVEPRFMLVQLRAISLDSRSDPPPAGWLSLWRRRAD